MKKLSTEEIEGLTRRLSEEFVAVANPKEAQFFSLIWRECRKQGGVSGKRQTTGVSVVGFSRTGLPYEGGEKIELVSPWTIFSVGAVLHELNSQGKVPQEAKVQEAIRLSAETFGASEGLARKLANQLGREMCAVFYRAAVGQADQVAEHTENKFVVWLGESGNPIIKEDRLPWNKVKQRYLPRERDFDIFIQERKVFISVKGKMHPLELEERLYRLLVMFLRYKGREIGVIDLYCKAWRRPVKPRQEDEKPIVNDLKVAVSNLRTKLWRSGVRKLTIPSKRFLGGYLCAVEGSFCIILKCQLASEFRV